MKVKSLFQNRASTLNLCAYLVFPRRTEMYTCTLSLPYPPPPISFCLFPALAPTPPLPNRRDRQSVAHCQLVLRTYLGPSNETA